MQITLPDLPADQIYAGIILKSDGTPDYHLVLLPGDNDSGSWDTQMSWAKKLEGDLPTRQEQSLLFSNTKQHFKKDWYWLNQHNTEAGWAWSQSFTSGPSIATTILQSSALALSADCLFSNL